MRMKTILMSKYRNGKKVGDIPIEVDARTNEGKRMIALIKLYNSIDRPRIEDKNFLLEIKDELYTFLKNIGAIKIYKKITGD